MIPFTQAFQENFSNPSGTERILMAIILLLVVLLFLKK